MNRIHRTLTGLWRNAAVLASIAAALAVFCPAPTMAQGNGTGAIHMLAVGVCPPYRKEIPVAVCRNSAHGIADAFEGALNIDKANVTVLSDEQSTGQNFLRTLADLKDRLTPADRLIVYINAHGDPFGDWARVYNHSGPIAAINKRYKKDDYLMVFWTKEEPSVPALAVAQKDWLLIEEIVAALDALPAKVALILDSCSSARSFTAFHRHAKATDNIDYIATAAAPEQVAFLNGDKTMALFTDQIIQALTQPTIRNLGAAITLARVGTTQTAIASCLMQTTNKAAYAEMFPHLAIPTDTGEDGTVHIPLWFCSQAPSVADFSGAMTEIPLYGHIGPQTARRR